MRVLWKPEKNEWLKKERGLSFEQIEMAIIAGQLISILKNKNYKNQIIFVVELEGYIIAVPILIRNELYFFMTAYPSRALLKKYRRKT